MCVRRWKLTQLTTMLTFLYITSSWGGSASKWQLRKRGWNLPPSEKKTKIRACITKNESGLTCGMLFVWKIYQNGNYTWAEEPMQALKGQKIFPLVWRFLCNHSYRTAKDWDFAATVDGVEINRTLECIQSTKMTTFWGKRKTMRRIAPNFWLNEHY